MEKFIYLLHGSMSAESPQIMQGYVKAKDYPDFNFDGTVEVCQVMKM